MSQTKKWDIRKTDYLERMNGAAPYTRNGKVADERREEDYFGAFRQLGLIPTPPTQ